MFGDASRGLRGVDVADVGDRRAGGNGGSTGIEQYVRGTRPPVVAARRGRQARTSAHAAMRATRPTTSRSGRALGRGNTANDVSRLMPQGHTQATTLSGRYSPVSHPVD